MEALLKKAFVVIQLAKVTIMIQKDLIAVQIKEIAEKDVEIEKLRSELAFQRKLNESTDSVLLTDFEYELHLLSDEKEKALKEFIQEMTGESNEDNHIQAA